MKNAFIILILFLVVIISTAQEKKLPDYYILLDRNSPNIEFRGETDFYKTGVYRAYAFLSEINDPDHPLYASLYQTEITKEYHTVTVKPLSFLDSIPFRDEKWLRETTYPEGIFPLYFDSKNRGSVYVLDKATIKNDSIVMYRVALSTEGRFIHLP